MTKGHLDIGTLYALPTWQLLRNKQTRSRSPRMRSPKCCETNKVPYKDCSTSPHKRI
ncbi:hypothetical protein HanXRQr2_Chr03g0132711 [Helianthus annuus]|uniref:Uncharacterized protein n=1 Tax=Helianthus annuus TaxID=4232 RepID=A0A9K3NXJ8_HELAN|nr:hypothetical protein HanXRQr2_Chr03g0132711 [Helianthus annuus]KAJ0945558.1 hypothetical protein HanPSC8_Chr03g0129481 [Helianthus annuus]